MNERYFVFAVIIAFIVPVIIGCFYFADVYEQKGNSNYVYKASEGRELLLFGSDKIENAKLTSSENHLDFKVIYVTGEKEYETYKILLDEIKVSSNCSWCSIKWVLSMFDETNNEYFNFATGIIDKNELDKIEISPQISIAEDKSQLFRLYYYLIGNNIESKEVSLNASIVLE